MKKKTTTTTTPRTKAGGKGKARNPDPRRPYKWIRVPEELHVQLAAIAQVNDRSANREAVRAIRAYVSAHANAGAGPAAGQGGTTS
jgi:hypothetical protein